MRVIAGRCIAAMAMGTPLGVWQHFLPRSEAPGPPCCLAVRSFRDPAVVMAQVLSLCEKIETLRCIEGITAVEQDKQ